MSRRERAAAPREATGSPSTGASSRAPSAPAKAPFNRLVLFVGLPLLGAAIALGAYVGMERMLRARDGEPTDASPAASRPAPATPPRPTAPVTNPSDVNVGNGADDAAANAAIAALEARANETMDRVEARWAQIRADGRAGRLAVDEVIAAYQKECMAPLEALSTELASPGSGGLASVTVASTRRDVLRGRVLSLLTTMDREAVSITRAALDSLMKSVGPAGDLGAGMGAGDPGAGMGTGSGGK